jgi:hypothetical protein
LLLGEPEKLINKFGPRADGVGFLNQPPIFFQVIGDENKSLFLVL